MSDPADASTVQQPRLEVPETSVAFSLDVAEGPDAGKRFVIGEQEPLPALLGTSPVCALRLADREVSRRHASLDIDGRALRLRDLGSTNGTMVDGVSVVEAILRPGQTLRMGKTALRVSRADSPPTPTMERESFGRLLGASLEMRRLYVIFARLAASNVPVLIEGETGTGKELLAECLHEQGPRAAAPFLVFDCSATSADAEAELFGRAAPNAAAGLFEQASGGTLLLDRVGQLNGALQSKLVRVLERSEVAPVGGAKRVRVDVRVLASTERDLDRDIQLGRFREDLFYRLAGTRVALPPLRRRTGDVQLLAGHFLRELSGERPLDAGLLASWVDYSWPGNVRELRNAVARWLVLGNAESAVLGAANPAAPDENGRMREELEHVVQKAVLAGVPLARSRQEILELYDRVYVERVLAAHGGNVSRAAIAAGVGRRYFQLLRAKQRGSESG